jgi:rubrerythrin
MSMVENLQELKAKGMDEFLKSQAEKYRCPNCGGVVCIHDGRCYSCGQMRQKTVFEAKENQKLPKENQVAPKTPEKADD